MLTWTMRATPACLAAQKSARELAMALAKDARP